MSNLKVLNLSRNPITKVGIIGLYSKMQHIKVLNLTGTLLKDDGLEELLPLL